MLTLTIDVPRTIWLSSNQRLHWRTKADRTQALRTLANVTARNTGLKPIDGPVTITTHIGYPPNVHRVDPGNAHPTSKALIDGLVDAGILTDDSSDHVIDGGHRRDPTSGQPGTYRIRLELTGHRTHLEGT